MNKDTRLKVNQYVKSIDAYLAMLRDSGSFRKRQEIRLSDAEMSEYFELMRAEVLLLPIDAFAADQFLAHVDGRPLNWWERVGKKLGLGRRPLLEQYRAYLRGIKANLRQDGGVMLLRERTDDGYIADGTGEEEAVHGAGRRPGGADRGGQRGHGAEPGRPGVPVRGPGREGGAGAGGDAGVGQGGADGTSGPPASQEAEKVI